MYEKGADVASTQDTGCFINHYPLTPGAKRICLSKIQLRRQRLSVDTLSLGFSTKIDLMPMYLLSEINERR